MIRFLERSCRYSRVTGSAKPRSLLTIDEVVERLALSRETVRRLVKSGRLPAVQIVPGGHLRFRPEDVDALCEPNVGAAA